MNTTTDFPHEGLRASMVDYVKECGHARSARVEEVMRAVPRHLFVPLASVEDAYADMAVITKSADNGAALSCASVPVIVGMMLDQLDVRPGDRVLEIGAGTGYNAALLAELVGEDGQVTTVDIDAEVTAGARQALDATGYRHVRVITRDGSLGAEEHAPYDRIVVTVGAWDLPPAWWDQLTPGGRLVVPLRWRGQTRSVAFVRETDRMRSDSVQLCGFVPMIGADQDGERTGHLDTDGLVSLYWDSDQAVDLGALRGVLNQKTSPVWSSVTVGGQESFDGVWLRLASAEPATCRISAEAAAIATNLCTPAIPSRSPALVEGDSLAYLTVRRADNPDERRAELGAIGQGPAGLELAARLCDEIRAWDRDRTAQPVITAYPADTPDDQLGASAVRKRNSRLVISR